ncbi:MULTISPECIES: protein DpdG [Nocardiopsis]|uniref:protein DpdG n=1 Tax=Nocardiopsis TaxID=2013 RepID=UPI0009894147|nr:MULTISPECIES: protein DpdG [Nocardiopsis]
MSLLNVHDSLPIPMWTVMRFLIAHKRPISFARAKAFVNPPSVRGDGKAFDNAVGNLEEFGLVTRTEDDRLGLSEVAQKLDGNDPKRFNAVLRDAVLHPDRNTGIGDNDSQTGPRDLTRALAWFLSYDPHHIAPNWGEAQALMARNPIRPEAGHAVVNDTRWTRFSPWSTALGLTAPSTLQESRLVPDCTTAVKQVVQASWKAGETVSAVEVLAVLREALPVLPGGAYALALGLPSPGKHTAGPALSFALLRGEDEDWIRLERNADARYSLSVHDPEATHPVPYNSISVLEDLDG